LTFAGSLTVLFSEVIGFALEEHIGLTLEELEAGLLRAGKKSAKTWLASSGGLRIISKIRSVKIGFSVLI